MVPLRDVPFLVLLVQYLSLRGCTGPKRTEALQPDLAAIEQNLREPLLDNFYHLLGPSDGDCQLLSELFDDFDLRHSFRLTALLF